jgi:hypothetical protein
MSLRGEGSYLAPEVSVVMPTFDQAAYLPRAVGSLQRQTFQNWELVVIDDGSPDTTADAVAGFDDSRIRYYRLPANGGLGAACNAGIDLARAALVTYLPSDDVLLPEHIACLTSCFGDDGAVLAWSAAQADDRILGANRLQLVQVMHRRTADRWTERGELESDDLELLFWHRLRRQGRVVSTGQVTCAWVQHPAQRHRVMREAYDGGLNTFRARYQVPTPLRFRSTDGPLVDEPALYMTLRDRPRRKTGDGLRILLVGELAFNPERVVALEERGHELFGLWITNPLGDSTVGPLPFGHVRDLPHRGWREAVQQVRPDVVYGLLNWRAVPLVHEVAFAGLDVPVVWHFKEAPQRCIARGSWPQLADLHADADAVVYASRHERDWFEEALPGRRDRARTFVLDGDLPKADWLAGPPSPRLSEQDGELHTVCVGRPIGLDAEIVQRLAASGIHLHLYGLVQAPGPKGSWRYWLDDAVRRAPSHLHVHPHVDQRGWVAQLSCYDAGWLHRFRSDNGGELARATWDDLNVPARLPVYLAAGVPALVQRSPGSSVAVQEVVQEHGVGLVYDDVDDLIALLHDEGAMKRARDRVWSQRHVFTFDAHADRLVALFRQVAR